MGRQHDVNPGSSSGLGGQGVIPGEEGDGQNTTGRHGLGVTGTVGAAAAGAGGYGASQSKHHGDPLHGDQYASTRNRGLDSTTIGGGLGSQHQGGTGTTSQGLDSQPQGGTGNAGQGPMSRDST